MMMTSRPGVYCEPFCIKDGYDFEIHHVAYSEKQPYTCDMHFHEVHELIFFEKIDGTFFYHKGESQLQNYDVVFTPAMETHDFNLSDKAKSWFIVQFPTNYFDSQGLENMSSLFDMGMHLRIDPLFQDQLLKVIRWAHESFNVDKGNAKTNSLLNLAMVLLKQHGNVLNVDNPRILSSKSLISKIQPVVDIFRNQFSVDLSLEEAAQKCHLSPSYFSRVFKSIFRFAYSEYVIRHKLYNAARILGQSTASITQISYDLNFSNPSHFIALFKKQFGCTPNRYRNAITSRITRRGA